MNITLIAQRFSPYDKVGARRWSKFIHYLQLHNDIQLYVITQDYFIKQKDNPWNIELKKEKVNVIYVNDFFAKLKFRFPFLSKLTNFIQYKILKYTDEGYGFSVKAFDYLEKYKASIKPDLIIATSPAYSTCYFAAKFKTKFPEIKLINDYRDAWVDGFLSWNKHLNEQSPIYKKQIEMEKYSLNHCDAVVSVTPELLDKLRSKIENKKIITKLITNGFDKRDKQSENLIYPVVFDKTKINICHFGTLDFGRDLEFIKFVKTAHLPEDIHIYLIGNINRSLYSEVEKNKSISHIDQLPPNQLHSLFHYADYHLIINDIEFYFAYGSKVFDAMLYEKPILFISKENSLTSKFGNSSDFLHSNNSIEVNQAMISIVSKKDKIIAKSMNYSEFDIENLSSEYLHLINLLIKK